MGQAESIYSGKITIYNRSPHAVDVSLYENCVRYKNNGPKKMVKNQPVKTVVTKLNTTFDIPGTPNWDADYPLNDILNDLYVKVDFKNSTQDSNMFYCGYLNFGRSMDENIMILKDCSVTYSQDPNIDWEDYPGFFETAETDEPIEPVEPVEPNEDIF